MTRPRAKIDDLLEEARAHVEPDWSPAREEGALRGVYRQQQRRQRSGRALRAAGGALAVIAVALLAHRLARPPAPVAVIAERPPVRAPAAPGLGLPDGAIAEPLAGAVLEAGQDRAGRPLVRLRGGGVRFRAAPGPVRTFRVEVAGVSVEVVGTQFIIEEIAAGARVRAGEEGLRVLFGGQAVDLSAHEVRSFGGPAGPAATETPAERPRRAARPGRWRALAQEGQFDRAYGALKQDDPQQAIDEIDAPGDLLLLADVARLSRHPREAVAPLERLLGRHRRDPRAPLAAFTLGRVQLDDLGRPREAAASFLRARQLDPGGPMAQDALAREVEALSRAGDVTRARQRAEAYLRLYPDGRRLRSVRRFGGLD